MNWKFWAPPAPPPPASIDPSAFQLVAKAPVFNPSDEQQVTFAEYRADAIAREIEQRQDEGRERHPEHAQVVAEAMAYAWMLVRSGQWPLERVRILQKRLER